MLEIKSGSNESLVATQVLVNTLNEKTMENI